METIPISMNAVRVCDAIARIGYEPHSALMDIIDNSVAADALNVSLYVDLVEGKTINQRNNVVRYRVVDDGKGMDEDGIKNAFKLGSDANYKQNSLSKYGMGLKSAGFSLGIRIQIISKKEGQLTRKYYLDRKIIEDKNEYVVCYECLTEAEIEESNTLLPNDSGTIVEITGCGFIYHTSAKTTIEKLKHRLGVTYYTFLAKEEEEERLNIKLIYPGEAGLDIKPFDILFTEDAESSFDPTSYDAKKPCFAFKDVWNIPATGDEGAPPIKLEVVTFPQDTMGNASSPLNEEDRARVRSYRVSRENKGFFIYRNGRLIRWGDDLDNLVPKDLIGFRARMELSTEHDDLLHVDVSKQRIEMDDETRNNLDLLMRLPRKQAVQVSAVCKDLLKKGNGEGAGFTNTADSVPEEDPIEDLTPPDPTERKERAKKREEESKETLDKIKPEEPAEETTSEDNEFVKIRYSDNLPGMNLWSTQKDSVQGTYVIINRRHAFYQSVLANMDESSPERLAIEAVIFCCAVGENKTFENLTSVSEDNIRRVFERHYSVFSFNISAWATGNQHIFGNIKI